MQPMNYTIDPGSNGNSFMQGFQNTSGMMATAADYQKAQAMATLAQQKAEADAYKRQRFADVAKNPSIDEVNRLLVEFPDLHEGLKKSLDYMGDQEKKNTLENISFITSAVESGNNDLANKLIDQQIEAAKNSNNAYAVKRAETLKTALAANPKAFLSMSNGLLLANLGADGYEKLQKAQTTQQTREYDVATAKAGSEKAVFDVRKASADAVLKEVEAKFAPQAIMAELGLKKAQTNAANASAGASSASAAASRATAARANAEASQINAGVIPAEKRPEAETKFRDEYAKRTAGYQEVKQSYGRVLSSNNDAAGDLSLIFGYMKMLDPGSVVREGEFANAQNAAGVPDRIQNIYNKVRSGERLTEGQRKMFKGQAESLYKTAAKQEEEIRSGIGRIATGYGLNTKNIFYTEKETAPQSTASPIGATLPGGFKVLGVEKK